MHPEAPDLLEIWVGGGYICFLRKQISIYMNEKHKELYDVPSTKVLELKTESCLLQTSDYNYGNLDEPNNVMSLMNGQDYTF